MHDATNTRFRRSEINQQADLQTGCLKIIQALRSVNIVERFHRFNLDDDASFYQKISNVIADHDFPIANIGLVLLRHPQTRTGLT